MTRLGTTRAGRECAVLARARADRAHARPCRCRPCLRAPVPTYASAAYDSSGPDRGAPRPDPDADPDHLGSVPLHPRGRSASVPLTLSSCRQFGACRPLAGVPGRAHVTVALTALFSGTSIGVTQW